MTTGEKRPASTDIPEVGKPARDTARQHVGVVVAIEGSCVQLRSLTSGKQWTADLEIVRKLSAREELSARLAVANAATGWSERCRLR
jgi:hypothetical protein